MKEFTVGYTFASLRLRNYRLLWLAQLGTSMGQWMDQMNRGLVPLGTFIAGVLAEHLGGPLALQIMSLAVLGVVVLVSLLTPRFLKLRIEFQDRVPTR